MYFALEFVKLHCAKGDLDVSGRLYATKRRSRNQGRAIFSGGDHGRGLAALIARVRKAISELCTATAVYNAAPLVPIALRSSPLLRSISYKQLLYEYTMCGAFFSIRACYEGERKRQGAST